MNQIALALSNLGLTERDAELLSFLSEHPGSTFVDIATGTGLSFVTVWRGVKDLTDRGFVTKEMGSGGKVRKGQRTAFMSLKWPLDEVVRRHVEEGMEQFSCAKLEASL